MDGKAVPRVLAPRHEYPRHTPGFPSPHRISTSRVPPGVKYSSATSRTLRQLRAVAPKSLPPLVVASAGGDDFPLTNKGGTGPSQIGTPGESAIGNAVGAVGGERRRAHAAAPRAVEASKRSCAWCSTDPRSCYRKKTFIDMDNTNTGKVMWTHLH
jgi:hypothetical protein